jgi:hypothetical protein
VVFSFFPDPFRPSLGEEALSLYDRPWYYVGMKTDTLKVLEVKADDGGKAVNIRVNPELPVKIVTLEFKSASRQQIDEIVRTLERLRLSEITVTTN